MYRISTLAFLGLLSFLPAFAAQAPRPANKHTAAPKAAPVQPQPAAAPVAPQEAPSTPEHGPSSPPDVTFQNGQLTIVARNSTMGDILNAVKQKTGASVETPGASTERVVGQFGPGAPRDVMAQLLNGSHYDYVLLGSPENPGALKRVVLMARAVGPEPAPQPQNQQSFQDNENLQAVPDVENEPPPDEGPVEVQEVPQEEEQPQPDQQQGAPVVKTPEQLLRDLQQQQQQQQQQQEQPPPGAPGAPPQ